MQGRPKFALLAPSHPLKDTNGRLRTKACQLSILVVLCMFMFLSGRWQSAVPWNVGISDTFDMYNSKEPEVNQSLAQVLNSTVHELQAAQRERDFFENKFTEATDRLKTVVEKGKADWQAAQKEKENLAGKLAEAEETLKTAVEKGKADWQAAQKEKENLVGKLAEAEETLKIAVEKGKPDWRAAQKDKDHLAGKLAKAEETLRTAVGKGRAELQAVRRDKDLLASLDSALANGLECLHNVTFSETRQQPCKNQTKECFCDITFGENRQQTCTNHTENTSTCEASMDHKTWEMLFSLIEEHTFTLPEGLRAFLVPHSPRMICLVVCSLLSSVMIFLVGLIRNRKFQSLLALALSNTDNLKAQLNRAQSESAAMRSEADRLKLANVVAQSKLALEQSNSAVLKSSIFELEEKFKELLAQRDTERRKRKERRNLKRVITAFADGNIDEAEKFYAALDTTKRAAADEARTRRRISDISRQCWQALWEGKHQKMDRLVATGIQFCDEASPKFLRERRSLEQLRECPARMSRRNADPREWCEQDVVDYLQFRFSNDRIKFKGDGKSFMQNVKLMLGVWTLSTNVDALQSIVSELEDLVFEADILKGTLQGFDGCVIKESEVKIEPKPFASGSFADVYSAVWRGKNVALKVLKGMNASSTSRKDLETLTSEIKLTAKAAGCEFIVKCYGLMIGTRFGIVMDEAFCNLNHLISNDNLGDTRNRVRIVFEIAQGLRALHGVKLVHGDIKPANILVGTDGKMKIADFGSSVVHMTQTTMTRQSVVQNEPSQVGGTIQYMAPEMFSGSRGTASDIWAYGLIVWNVMTESLTPWEKLNEHQIMHRIVTQRSLPLVPLNCDRNLGRLFSDCCQYDPGNRPNSNGVVSALEGVLSAFRIQDEFPWPALPGKDLYEMIPQPLAPGSDAFERVAKLFKETCSHLIIVKVEMIQNAEQWNLFRAKERAMQSKNGTVGAGMKQLFHGTRHDVVPMINYRSFNRSYCGYNATVYGKGTYFARDASYSADTTYSPPDPQALSYMYLARVLVGTFAVGGSDMKEPPPMPGMPERRYDTTTNSQSDPSIYVVYHDAQAYPEYLITFKRS